MAVEAPVIHLLSIRQKTELKRMCLLLLRTRLGSCTHNFCLHHIGQNFSSWWCLAARETMKGRFCSRKWKKTTTKPIRSLVTEMEGRMITGGTTCSLCHWNHMYFFVLESEPCLSLSSAWQGLGVRDRELKLNTLRARIWLQPHLSLWLRGNPNVDTHVYSRV